MPILTPNSVIPHRPPHLWVDEITAVTLGEEATGLWTPGQEHYDGHFGAPFELLMGVKQVEAGAQVGAFAIMYGLDEDVLPIFAGIDGVRFPSMVAPGSTMTIHTGIVERKKKEFKGEIEVQVGGNTTTHGYILGRVVPRSVLMRSLGLS